jgi:uncharacterized protein DUF4410
MKRDIAALGVALDNIPCRLSLLLMVVGLVGCASDAPSVRYTQRMRPEIRILQDDQAHVVISASPGVTISPYERDRFAEQIVRAVRITAHGGARTPSAYVIEVQLTKYNKGSAAARFILAGLGQIHIVGNVSVYEGNVTIAQFHIEKTFAFGGIYGGNTRIDDVEKGFAQGIANAVCGAD